MRSPAKPVRNLLTILVQSELKSFLLPPLMRLVWQLGRKMDAMRSKSGPASETEATVHSTTEATELCSDVLRAGAASVTEIEKLIGELQKARDHLHTEGEWLQREATRYAHLTQTALASVTIISDRMNKWREAAVPPSAGAA